MATTPVDYDELFPGRFLKAVEFKGKEYTLQIADVELEEMPRGKNKTEVKVLVTFSNAKKQVVLNRTNAECIKAMFGRKIADWIGKKVTFYPVQVDAFGSRRPAIRVRGSPDLEKDIRPELQIGWDRITVTLKRTGAAAGNGKAKPAPAPEPQPEPADDVGGLDGLPPDDGDLEQIPGQPPL